MHKNPWNELYKEHGTFFGEPHEDMPGIAELLKKKGGRTVLDLGSGTGRHVLYFCKNGFSVYGLDGSPEGIEITRSRLKEEGLTADLRVGNMEEDLPYEDKFFDAVISIQVIHHATIAVIRGVVDEITRVLKRGGLLFFSVPGRRNPYETYEEIEPNTYIPQNGIEAGLPHHYFTPEALRELMKDYYEVTDIHVDSVDHYCVSAMKR